MINASGNTGSSGETHTCQPLVLSSMKKEDLAYLAGIVDGEGCIHIGKDNGSWGNRTPRYILVLQVSMVDKTPLLLAQFAFGGYLRLRHRKNLKWKPLWEWGIKSAKAVSCLRDLLPYLRTKRAEAELGITFWEQSNHEKTFLPKTAEQIAFKESAYLGMRALKDKSSIE